MIYNHMAVLLKYRMCKLLEHAMWSSLSLTFCGDQRKDTRVWTGEKRGLMLKNQWCFWEFHGLNKTDTSRNGDYSHVYPLRKRLRHLKINFENYIWLGHMKPVDEPNLQFNVLPNSTKRWLQSFRNFMTSTTLSGAMAWVMVEGGRGIGGQISILRRWIVLSFHQKFRPVSLETKNDTQIQIQSGSLFLRE